MLTVRVANHPDEARWHIPVGCVEGEIGRP